jgi:putative glutamine amidotransferase
VKPIIGIVGTPFDETREVRLGYEGRQTGTRTTYEDAIIKAGGIPIILSPSTEQEIITSQLNLVDGLLMQGGDGDIENIHISYIKEALNRDLPILGICMGMQLINVALGGKIAIIRNGISHIQTTPLYMLSHNILIETNSKLFELFAKGIKVNSHHKYGITELARDLTATAKSEDGLIEAVETACKKFALGVQWHPEHLLTKNDKWLKLFELFVSSCK